MTALPTDSTRTAMTAEKIAAADHLDDIAKALTYAAQCLDGVISMDEEDEGKDGGSATCQSCVNLVNRALGKVEKVRPLLDELDRLKARVAEMKAGGWQPIETAPKDGTKVDVWVCPWDAFANGNAARITNAWFEDGKWKRILSGWTHDIEDCGEPTHWQPLPAPPSRPLPTKGDTNE